MCPKCKNKKLPFKDYMHKMHAIKKHRSKDAKQSKQTATIYDKILGYYCSKKTNSIPLNEQLDQKAFKQTNNIYDIVLTCDECGKNYSFNPPSKLEWFIKIEVILLSLILLCVLLSLGNTIVTFVTSLFANKIDNVLSYLISLAWYFVCLFALVIPLSLFIYFFYWHYSLRNTNEDASNKHGKIIKTSKLWYIAIFAFCAVDFSLFILNVHNGIHYFVFFYMVFFEVPIDFLNKDPLRWHFLFCCTLYGIMLLLSILL